MLYILFTNPTLSVLIYALELNHGNVLWNKVLYTSEKNYLSPIIGDDGTVYVCLYGFEGLVYIMAIGVPQGDRILIVTIFVGLGCLFVLALLGFWKYKRSIVPADERGKSIWWCFRDSRRKKPLWRPNRVEKLKKRKKRKKKKPTGNDEEKQLLEPEENQVLTKEDAKKLSKWEFLSSKFHV